jgi:hypothetical protein
VTVEVAAGDLLRGNVPELEGTVVGQKKELDHAFAKDDPEATRAGKTGHFTFSLKGLKRQLVPTLDDDFAKEVGGGETLAELRSKVRNDLEVGAKNRAAQEEREQLLKALVERNPFELPKAMIERGLDAMLDGALRMMARQGLDPVAAQPGLRLAQGRDAAQGGGRGAWCPPPGGGGGEGGTLRELRRARRAHCPVCDRERSAAAPGAQGVQGARAAAGPRAAGPRGKDG